MSSETPAASGPISSLDVPWTEWSDVPALRPALPASEPRRARRPDYHVGVAIEELPPGKQSAPAHYHVFEEEHVYILEGALTVRIGAATHAMKAGDYVCFPAGQKAGHCLVNDGGATCRYVIVGERNPNEVVVYTDSGQGAGARAGSARDLRSRGDARLLGRRGHRPSGGRSPAVRCRRTTPETPVEPKPPISSDDVDWDGGRRGTAVRRPHQASHPCRRRAADYHVGMLIEAPAPGMRLAPMHYHMLEEEHALILEGQVTLLLGEERHDMQAGRLCLLPRRPKSAIPS